MSGRVVVLFAALVSGFAQAQAWAGLSAPDFEVRVSSTSGSGPTRIAALAPKGHHVNTQAPIWLVRQGGTRIGPSRASRSEADFEVTSAGTGAIELYLCDDANTYCEKHRVAVAWGGKGAAAAPSIPRKPTPNRLANPTPAVDEHGFIDNDPERAFALAKKERRPLLVDIYGIWCPPCNELADRVFSSRGFKKATARFVRVKLDADREKSEPWLLRYGIQGFPTVLFLDSEGDEISRLMGFRPKAEFFAAVRAAWKGRHDALAQLKARADAGNRAASDRLGRIYLDRGDNADASHYLEGTRGERERYFQALAGVQEDRFKSGDAAAQGAWIQALKTAIAEYPSTPDSLMLRDELASLLDDDKKTKESADVRRALVATATKLLADPSRLRGYDCAVSDLWTSIAESQDALGEKRDAAVAWNRAADEFRKTIAAGAERGGVLELAYCLRQLGRFDEAAQLYEKMQRRYPSEFTYFLGDAKMNLQLKRYERARDLALEALAKSYDVNRLDSAQVLAEIYKEMKQPDQARKVIRDALASVPPLPPAGRQGQGRVRPRVAKLEALEKSL